MSEQKDQPKTEGIAGIGSKEVLCRACGYSGDIDTYDPCMSVYNDCRCPKCGSTNNQHNEDYQRDLFAAMNKT